jgi:anti-sigma factor RsiW
MTPVTHTHEHFEQLLGAFVLHAVDDDEFELVERHLEVCPRCSSEVDDRYEIAAALGNVPAAVPEQLWDRIVGQLAGPADRPAEFFSGAEEGTSIVKLDRAARRSSVRRARSDRARTVSRLSVAAVAAAVIALLAVNLSSADGRLVHEQSAMDGHAAQAQVQAALDRPGHQIVELGSVTNAHLAEFVLADGVGYAVSSAMPTLPPDETYQLWATIGGQPISLGLLGDHIQRGAAFSLRSERGRAVNLLVTVEPAGGVVVPDSASVGTARIIDV